MKRFVIVSLVFVLLLALAGCGSYKVSMDEAKDIAVHDANADRISVSQLTGELDKSSNPAVYRVNFVIHAQKVTYVINADTGEIISKTP